MADVAADYRQYLNADALRGARIGIPREVYTGYSEKTDAVFATVIETLQSLGAVLVDPANLPAAKQIQTSEAEMTVLLYEFKANLNAYLAALGPEAQAHSLEELIAFNREHAEREMPYFGQELFEMAQAKGALTEQEYLDARAECLRMARDEGIDAVMREHNLDALCMPTGEPAWKIDLIDGDHSMGGASQPAALAGYPAISVPAGYTFGLPLGVTFMGLAYSEPKLIGFAYAFEQATTCPPRADLSSRRRRNSHLIPISRGEGDTRGASILNGGWCDATLAAAARRNRQTAEGQPMSAYHPTFVSHAHADNDLCDRYVNALQKRGIDIWYDRNNAQSGHFLGEQIQQELTARSAFVLLMTEASLKSFWVRLERETYLGLMANDPARILVAVRIGPCQPPPMFNAFLWIDALALPFEQAIDEIARALITQGKRIDPPPPPPPRQRCPRSARRPRPPTAPRPIT